MVFVMRIMRESCRSWSGNHVTVASEPERNGVFLTRSCVHVTDISCGVVYEATLASLVLFRGYCYVMSGRKRLLLNNAHFDQVILQRQMFTLFSIRLDTTLVDTFGCSENGRKRR